MLPPRLGGESFPASPWLRSGQALVPFGFVGVTPLPPHSLLPVSTCLILRTPATGLGPPNDLS